MQTLADITTSRLENVLSRDKKMLNENLCTLLKSDLFSLLENYFNIQSLTLNLTTSNGGFGIQIFCHATQAKNIGFMQ